MNDLDRARADATRREETSGDYATLQEWVFALCDEIEELRKHE